MWDFDAKYFMMCMYKMQMVEKLRQTKTNKKENIVLLAHITRI